MAEPAQVCVVQTIGAKADISGVRQTWNNARGASSVVMVETGCPPGTLAYVIAGAVADRPAIRSLRWEGYSPRLMDVLDLAGPCLWVLFLSDGYVLSEEGFAELTRLEADVVYGDEISCSGVFHKPAWSLDLALEQDVVGGVCAVRRPALSALSSCLLEPPHDIALRLAATARVGHLPRITSYTAGMRRNAPGARAVDAALDTWRATPVKPHIVPSPAQRSGARIAWRAMPPPLVTVVIPIRDRPDLLERCAAGILHCTDYPAIQLLIADNDSIEPATAELLARLSMDSRVTILSVPGPFNYARINNLALAASAGEVILLLNNDIEILEPDWLTEMVGLAMRPGTGAVGAKLLYPGGTVQHAGVVLGIGVFEGGPGIAGHIGHFAARNAPGYADQLVIARQVSAVTAACLATRRSVWDRVGGLDAETFAIALNDVDFCLRIRATGLDIVWTPHAVLLHHESATRGSDQTPANKERFHRECRALRDRWGPVLDADPFYNANFSRADHQFRSGP